MSDPTVTQASSAELIGGLICFGLPALVALGLAVGFRLLRPSGVLHGFPGLPQPGDRTGRWTLFGLAAGAYLLLSITAGVVLGILYGPGVNTLLEEPAVLLALTAAPWVLLLPILVSTSPFLPGRPWQGMGWRLDVVPQALVAALLILPVVAATNVLTVLVLQGLGIGLDGGHPLLQNLEPDPVKLGLMAVGVVLIVPFAEEVAFRGLLQGALRATLTPTRGPASAVNSPVSSPLEDEPPVPEAPPSPGRLIVARWGAIALTSLLFTVIHPMQSWPAIFVLSVLMGYAYERTGSLWTPIVVHVAFNGLNFGLVTLVTLTGLTP